jgi:hypothetical protein
MKFQVSSIEPVIVEENMRYLRDGRKVELMSENEQYCTVREIGDIRDDDDYEDDHHKWGCTGSTLRGGEPFFVKPSDLCRNAPAELNLIIHEEIKKAEEMLAGLTKDIEESRKSYREVTYQFFKKCISSNVTSKMDERRSKKAVKNASADKGDRDVKS